MNRPHVDLSPNLSPMRREALNVPPSVKKKGFVLCHLPYKGRTRGVGRGWGLGLMIVVHTTENCCKS
jgi:hypothetical protein